MLLDKEDKKAMREVCQLARQTLNYAASLIEEGISTNEIDKATKAYYQSLSCSSACLNYEGFPKSICTSINDVICHGLPSEKDILKKGDIINIDITLIKNGFFGDTSKTFPVGEISENAKNLIKIAEEAMLKGIAEIQAGKTVGDIGFATNKYVAKQGMFVVRDIGGHGIGKAFHLPPFVPAIGKKSKGEKLIEDTCITVEPMVNESTYKYTTHKIKNSNVSYFRTLNNCLSAQFEHTVLITKKGFEILTEEE